MKRTRQRVALLAAVAAHTWLVPAARAQLFTVDTTLIAATDVQPNGPAHDFHVARFEVTNAEFVTFLNDALVNLTNERGQYLHFDTDTGDVFLSATSNGVADTAGSGTRLFDAAASAHLSYNSGLAAYEVLAGFEDHPVVGVTWYGAVKYCNWLTIDQGLALTERAYREDTSANPAGWHPVTITTADWQTRDLTAGERQALVNTVQGFRLPMDDQSSTAALYNEWYKAAAWDELLQTAHVYGYGSDALPVAGDANYFNSGDPFESGEPGGNATTPVGFYDGTLYNPGGGGPVGDGSEFQTNPDANPYGLVDMSGNVQEWVQDQETGNTGVRRIRGGSYLVGTFSIRTDLHGTNTAGAASNATGFRVAHSSPRVPPLILPGAAVVTTLVGPPGGPFVPTGTTFTVTNDSWHALPWRVETDFAGAASWLDVSPSSGQLAPFGTIDVGVTTNGATALLATGQFRATLQFIAGAADDFTTNRFVDADVGEALDVSPVADFAMDGPTGGPFAPTTKVYRITNTLGRDIEWTAALLFGAGDPAWLTVTGGAFGDGTFTLGTLSDGFTADVTVALNTAVAVTLSGGRAYDATLLFTELGGANNSRKMRLSIGLSSLTVPMSIVSSNGVQPGGPAYTYRLGRFEITNAEYATFLNSARNNLNDGLGAYTYHDVDSGDVYINATSNGVIGTNGTGTLLFDASAGGDIVNTNGAYEVVAGSEDLPVVGVTWFGAVKFCNWLTLLQGATAGERAYTEGPFPGDWHPATIATVDWWGTADTANNLTPVAGARDLDAAERAALVSEYAGYRLPMDEGNDTASAYNEWYKAAAWDNPAAANRTYGFGRDVLGGVDANYLASGDPFDDGPTPTGFYDGVNLLADLTPTLNTDNSYGLYDLCGNLAEWVQDRGDLATQHTTRGGHWVSTVASPTLLNTTRSFDTPDQARSWTGFRIAQTVLGPPLDVAFVCSNGVPCERVSGIEGGPYSFDTFTVALTNTSEAPREWTMSIGPSWVESDGEQTASGVVAANGGGSVTANVELAFNAATDALTAPPDAAITMALVPLDDDQPNGPAYSFRIGTHEVTNTEYAAFLNDAFSNPTIARGQYLFHDVDSGDVYMGMQLNGQTGTNGSGTLMFDAAINGCVSFNTNGNTYQVAGTCGDHPVSGVSWYGAVKYVNWLTIDDGLGSAQRAYAEGTIPGDWHPVTTTAAEWSSNGLSSAARDTLVETVRGYRLPMDDRSSAAAPFNEWYKAAAWNPVGDVNALYGYGRDIAPTPADANYSASGDPFEPGTTPVGFYDGSTYDTNGTPDASGPFLTDADSNGYGVFDACGNVSEWVQDIGAGIADRGLRGGDWRDAGGAAFLRTDGRAAFDAATPADFAGLRVAQAALDEVATVTVTDVSTGTTLLGRIRLLLTRAVSFTGPQTITITGLYGGPFTTVPTNPQYLFTSVSASAMDFSASVDQPWLWLNGSTSTNGTLPPSGSEVVTVSSNGVTATTLPGTHTATLTLRNDTTAYQEQRTVTLTITDPLSVAGTGDLSFSGLWARPFDDTPQTYTMSNLGTPPLAYEVTADDTWVTLDDGTPVTGTLTGGTPVNVDVSINSAAEALGVGTHTTTVRFRNTTLGTEVQRTVVLTVNDLLTLADANDFVTAGPDAQSGFIPPSKTFTLTNMDALPVDYSVSASQAWVTFNGGLATDSGQLLPGAEQPISVEIDAVAALALGEGSYNATVTFRDEISGFDHTRGVLLTVGDFLAVEPAAGLAAFGPVGGTLAPTMQVYDLTNFQQTPIDWQVRADRSWIRINGMAAPATGTLGVGLSTNVVVSIDDAFAFSVGATTNGTVTFENLTEGGNGTSSRNVSVTVVQPAFVPSMTSIPSTAAELNGPAYTYEIGTFEVRNDEFVAFLNDALANPDNERGQFTYVDTSTGDVYVNCRRLGEQGVGALTTLMFSPALGGQITFDGAAYAALAGFADHPVAGVTWYGALKYCNWMTIDQGLAPTERCYVEGTDADLNTWRPVEISAADFSTRDLTDAERQALVDGCRGFRLPMDDGSSNINVWDQADGYNEWYKAAAYDPAAPGTIRQGPAPVQAPIAPQHWVYAFGRDGANGGDANYSTNGDPFDDGTTAVGYFDGTLRGSFPTNTNSNGFGVFDMAGNVFEWVQDKFNASSGRAVRGGSWMSLPGSTFWIDAAGRSQWPPASAHGTVGLRVVRVPATIAGSGDADGDGDRDLRDFADMQRCFTGTGGGPVNGSCLAFDSDADGDVDDADAAFFLTSLTGPL